VPTFTSQQPNLAVTGPVVSIELAVGSALEVTLQAAGEAVPAPITTNALIDTGASASVIQQGLAARLGLHAVGVVPVNTPSSTNVMCLQYAVRFVLPSRIVVDVTAIEAPLQGQNIQCLIGRDILAGGVLVYNGCADMFSLSLS
jgi:hypothetical protein